MGKVFVGLDWAEDHHDVFVEDDTGRRLGAGRLAEGVAGIARFHELLADHVEEPAQVVIATETDRGLFINTLVAAGYTVLAINPMSTARYRERYSTSGAKSDPGDAKVLECLRLGQDTHARREVDARKYNLRNLRSEDLQRPLEEAAMLHFVRLDVAEDLQLARMEIRWRIGDDTLVKLRLDRLQRVRVIEDAEIIVKVELGPAGRGQDATRYG